MSDTSDERTRAAKAHALNVARDVLEEGAVVLGSGSDGGIWLRLLSKKHGEVELKLNVERVYTKDFIVRLK